MNVAGIDVGAAGVVGGDDHLAFEQRLDRVTCHARQQEPGETVGVGVLGIGVRTDRAAGGQVAESRAVFASTNAVVSVVSSTPPSGS